MLTVRQLLDAKPPGLITVEAENPVRTAIQLMAQYHIGALPVLRGPELTGIISERDYARKVVLRGLTSKDTTVGDLMTGKVITVGPEWTADQCMALMTEHHIRHLPVLDGDRVLGVISIGDAVKAVVDDQHFVIGQLTNYISQT